MQTIFDPVSIEAEIKRLAAAVNGKLPEPFSAFDIAEGGTYIYDRSLGLMRSVTYTRKVDDHSTTNTEVWTMRLVTPPTR